MRVSYGLALVASLASFTFACGTGDPAAPGGDSDDDSEIVAAAPPPSAPTAPADAPATTTTLPAQVAAGESLFASNCARCHGAGGEGVSAPALVGLSEGALGSFDTARDVEGYVARFMPPGQRGKLTEAEYYSIVAFLLKTNGVDLKDQALDAKTAGGVNLR